MFNAPRPAQPYGAGQTNGFGASFVDENPLSNSVYDDGLDPWSAAPSPSPPPGPTTPSLFNSVIADATVPAIYHKAFVAVDPTNTGETSVNLLSRVLGTSMLPAATIDKIVNLVSSKSRVSKLEFFVALALVALAQAGKDVSVEQVAALASQNTLPEPALQLDSLPSSTSNVAALHFTRQNPIPAIRPPVPAHTPSFSSEDPWSTARISAPFGNGASASTSGIGGSSVVTGTGLPKDWWRKQSKVEVNLIGQHGFILNRYMVYKISSERGNPVQRRYSEFVYLWDCLVRRYPFRLLPALPPKRIGPDEHFLELRRRGLARFLNFVINHPVIKDDGFLAVFLTEPSLEQWRKNSSVSLEEESTGKRVDRVEEMAIPSDLEEKLHVVRSKLALLIEQWQKICVLAERIIRRREAVAADLSRLTNAMEVLIEVNQPLCWRGEDCELSGGVRRGLGHVSDHFQMQADLVDQRTRVLLHTTLETLKSQRDLYVAMRDLFIRHSRSSIDQIDRLKKRVESSLLKLESVKTAQKNNWQDEADQIMGSIEKDQATIQAQLNRKVYIRACMWHELRVVLHNRENTLVALGMQDFAQEEHQFTRALARNWESLEATMEDMPYE